MLASFLMGLVGGQRAMTPLAVVSIAAARGQLPANTGAPLLIGYPPVAAATFVMAAAELAGDKMKSAPDRTVAFGLAARFVTSAIAGAALSTARNRWFGAAVGGSTAVLASYPGWRARTAAIPRYGRTRTGLIEDAMVVAAAMTIMQTLGMRRS